MIEKKNRSKQILGHSVKRFATEVFPYLWLLIAFVSLSIFMNTRIDSLLDSDMASELILAKMLNERGSILTSDWIYSSELRVLNTQLVFAPLFSLFNDWHVVRVIGSMILYAIMLLCYGYLCRQIRVRHFFLWTAPFLLLPVSEYYLQIVLEGVYYIPHISISFVTLGLILKIMKREDKKSFLYVILGLLSLLAGMGGLRQLLILYIPLLLTAVILYLQCKKVFQESVEEGEDLAYGGKMLLCTSDAAFCSGVGYLINDKILARFYQFQHYSGIKYAAYSPNRLAEVMNGFLYSLGYKTGDVFSVTTIRNGVCILLLFSVVVSLGYLSRGKNTSERRFLALFSIVAIVLFTVLYLFTDMTHTQRYNIPVLLMALPPTGIFLMDNPWKKSLRITLCVFLCVGVTACGLRLFYKATDRKPELHTIAAMLKQQGYSEGYATFWNGRVLTELTDGQIKVRVWGMGAVSEDVSYLEQQSNWLQPVSDAYTMPEGSFFLLFADNEVEAYSLGKLMTEHYSDHVIYDSAGYTIYGFLSYDEIDYVCEMPFEKGKWLTNGTDNDGVRMLDSGGVSNGPYITLKKTGIYQVTIEGTGLDDADVLITADSGKNRIPWDIVSHTDEELVLEFSVNSQLDNVECRVENVGENVLELSGITFCFVLE